MLRGLGVSSLVLLAACSRAREEVPAHAAAPPSVTPSAASSFARLAPASAAPSASAVPTTTPPDAEALRELDEIRRAAATCAATPSAPVCEGARELARAYPLMHCASDGIDQAYTFAWAAREPLPDATVFTDGDGAKWYVETARSPKLAHVDERLWSEGGWITVEPRLRFETDYPTAAEATRLATLDAQIKKKTKAEGIVRAVFHGDSFVGAFPSYAPLKPQKDGGMLYGFGLTPKKHPLCRSPQARVLPPELATFAGEWSRLR
jgi:hypothetical protein